MKKFTRLAAVVLAVLLVCSMLPSGVFASEGVNADSTVTALSEQDPAGTQEPETVQEPEIPEEPVVTPEPEVPEEPIVTPEPEVPEEPIVTPEPEVPEEPIVTPEPEITPEPANPEEEPAPEDPEEDPKKEEKNEEDAQVLYGEIEDRINRLPTADAYEQMSANDREQIRNEIAGIRAAMVGLDPGEIGNLNVLEALERYIQEKDNGAFEVNGEKYADFESAVEAVADGGTVSLIKDYTAENTLVINTDKSFTFTGANGGSVFTISYAGSGNLLEIRGSGSKVIDSLAFSCTGSAGAVIYNESASAELDNVSVSCAGSTKAVNTVNTLIISSGSFTGAVNVGSGAAAEIRGGTFEGAMKASDPEQFRISGGAFKSMPPAKGLENGYMMLKQNGYWTVYENAVAEVKVDSTTDLVSRDSIASYLSNAGQWSKATINTGVAAMDSGDLAFLEDVLNASKAGSFDAGKVTIIIQTAAGYIRFSGSVIKDLKAAASSLKGCALMFTEVSSSGTDKVFDITLVNGGEQPVEVDFGSSKAYVTVEAPKGASWVKASCISVSPVENLGIYKVADNGGATFKTTHFSEFQVSASGAPADVQITFDANGGSGTMSDVIVQEGSFYKLPKCGFTAQPGMKFYAWEVNEGEVLPGEEILIEGNTVVKALWEGEPIVEVTVSFNANGGSGKMADVTVRAGEEYTLPKCGFTAPKDKQFKAWQVFGEEQAPGSSVTITEDTQVKALWESIPVKQYTVSFNANGGSGKMADVTVQAGEEYTLPKCAFTAPSGKQFQSWAVFGQQMKPGDIITIDENTEVRALWKSVITPTATPTSTPTATPTARPTITTRPTITATPIDRKPSGAADDTEQKTAAKTGDTSNVMIWIIAALAAGSLLVIIRANRKRS